MEFPNWVEGESDGELIKEFYLELLQRYPELTEDIEYNEGLLHIDMGALQRLAEGYCQERKLEEAEKCFEWINGFFCRSCGDLLNAINVSFLEYFEYHKGLSEKEFLSLMPSTLKRGYVEMMAYMDNMVKDANKLVD